MAEQQQDEADTSDEAVLVLGKGGDRNEVGCMKVSLKRK